MAEQYIPVLKDGSFMCENANLCRMEFFIKHYMSFKPDLERAVMNCKGPRLKLQIKDRDKNSADFDSIVDLVTEIVDDLRVNGKLRNSNLKEVAVYSCYDNELPEIISVERKARIVLYIATSRDGFIADTQGSVDWLPQPNEVDDDCGFSEFLASIDVIAQGSRTFLQSLSFIELGIVPDLPFGGKHMYVFTREPMQTDRIDVTFVSSIKEFLALIEQDTQIKRVWLMGGAELIASFKAADLIDECIITVIPKDIGEGLALPKQVFDGMKYVGSTQYSHGIVEKRYVRM